MKQEKCNFYKTALGQKQSFQYGMPAIIGSLIFVGLQMRQEQEIALADICGSVSDNSLQLAQLIKGKGDLWRRDLDGDELSLAKQIEFDAMATSVESWFIMQWYRSKLQNASSPETDLRDVSIPVHRHTCLRRYFGAKLDRIAATNTAFDVPVDFSEWTMSIMEYLE